VEWWHVAAVGNVVLLLAYLGISAAVVVPLLEAGELRSNKLGLATALIFFSCAVGHGLHGVHLLSPSLGFAEAHGAAARAVVDWHLAVWEASTALVGLWYWTLRRSYGRLLEGAKLFEDLRERQREAAEINDTVVQGIVAAQLARRLGRDDESDAVLAGTLESARHLVSRLLQEASAGSPSDAGDFVRRTAAQLPGAPPRQRTAPASPAQPSRPGGAS
jgi:signal transduction histidine kinase